MFLEESFWVFDNIQKIRPVRDILDFGSGDFDYRRKKQLYVDTMYKKVRETLGSKIVPVDIRNSEGVDIVCDITQKSAFPESEKNKYEIVLACNILEHVIPERFQTVLRNIYKILKPNGYCIVTVPCNIEFHPAPIDNGFRPTCEELTSFMLPFFEKIIVETIECSHYREPYISHPDLLPKPIVTCGVFRKA